ncbi:MAG: sensor histidine kinase [Hyphomicrobiaceae bacterium]
MSLRFKLFVSIAASVLATFLIGSVLIYAHATAKIETEMRAALEVGARIAGNAADDVEESRNASRRLALLVADFNGDRHLRAFVVGPDGRERLASVAAIPNEEAPAWFVGLVKGERRNVAVPLPAAFDGLGRLVLEADPRNEASEAWKDTLKTLTILAILTGIIAMSVGAILELALRPLDRMAEAFGNIGTSLTAIEGPERGAIEYMRVYGAFNTMVDRVRQAEATSRRLSNQLLSVQEEERADIARDLHDEIGPFLFAVDVEAAALQRIGDDHGLDGVSERVANIRESISHMQGHVRGILARLRPPALLDAGLAHAVERLVGSWRGRQPDIRFDVAIDVPPLDDEIEGAVYRIVQEALSNAVRHGRPSRITVCVGVRDGQLKLAVSDDGAGLADHAPDGFGILGMEERARLHGGSLNVRPRVGAPGVSVEATIPLAGSFADNARYEAVARGDAAT